MMIYQTAYFSTASAGVTKDDLSRILTASRSNNAKIDVTGMLLLMDQVFFQVLEGGKEAVEALVEKIKANPLHGQMIIVSAVEREERAFPDWTMGFEAFDYDAKGMDDPDLPFDMSDLGRNPNIEALSRKAPEIIIFMRTLYRSRHMEGAPDLR